MSRLNIPLFAPCLDGNGGEGEEVDKRGSDAASADSSSSALLS